MYFIHVLYSLTVLQVACTLPGGTSAGAKELILGRITATLAAYRKYCATSSSTVRIQRLFTLQCCASNQAYFAIVLHVCAQLVAAGISCWLPTSFDTVDRTSDILTIPENYLTAAAGMPCVPLSPGATLSPPQVQLILPEALKLLPLFSLALQKSPILRADVRPDERSLWLAGVMNASCGRIMGLLHPRLFPVHHMLVRGSWAAWDR
jgi:hypothetical protein